MAADPLYGLETAQDSLMRVSSAEAQKLANAVILIGNLAPALVGQGFYSSTDMNGSAGSGRTANISTGKAIVGSAGNERYQRLSSIKNIAPSPDVDATYYVYLTQQLDTDGTPLYTITTSSTPAADTIPCFSYVASGGTAGSFNNLPTGRTNLGLLALQTYVQNYVPGVTTPAQITSNQNNYALTALSKFFRLSTDASRNITGFSGGVDGREVLITNVGSFNVVLVNQSASSTSTNRIITGTGADVTLAADASFKLWYDGTTGRWRNG